MILLQLLLICFTMISISSQRSFDYTLPNCGPTSDSIDKRKRARISFISHDSAISTFFHNPEQGSRDAANIVDVNVEWNRYLTTSEERMHENIRRAVDDRVDGIICSIPNDATYEAVQYAIQKKVPVIVFNSGLTYAKKLGLTSVLQDDYQAGLMLGENMVNANASKPLAVKLSIMEESASKLRLEGIIQSMLGVVPGILEIPDNTANDSFAPIQLIIDTCINGGYDSIISMGGSVTADLVATAVLRIRNEFPKKKVVTGLFDIGGSNMTTLFHQEQDTFGVTQLPYYQTALPVFLMYLRLMTGQDVYQNKTIKTGPNLVTNSTLKFILQSEQNSLLNLNEKAGSVGTIIPNTRGDTYNAAMLAGVASLARKLNWTVVNTMEEGPITSPFKFQNELDGFLKTQNINGIILQTSNRSLLSYASEKSMSAPNVGISALGSFFERYNISYPMISNIGLDFGALSRSIAKTMYDDGKLKPLCISERYNDAIASPFCSYFYQAYQEISGNNNAPTSHQVVQSVNISFPGAMENEFMKIMRRLQKDNYEPDAYITFSESVFSIINNRMLKGYLSNETALYTGSELFDQSQAFLEGRVRGLWATNMFSIGFMTLLHVVMDKVVTNFPSWDGTLISVPRVISLCEPGTYHTNFTTTAYCQDSDGNVQKSIKCIQCPENMYTSLPNQGSCKPCEEGYYAPIGSSSCLSCFDTHASENSTSGSNARSAHCAKYITDQEARQRKLFLSIFIPIGIVLLAILIGALIWYFRKRFLRQRALGSDETWLLRFDDLVNIKEGQKDVIAGADKRLLLGGTSSSTANNTMMKTASTPIIGDSHIITDNITTSMTTQGEENDALKRFSTNGVMSDQRIHDPATKVEGERGEEIMNTSKKGEAIITGMRSHQENKLIHALGFHRNLPVYIKQIGFKKVRVDAKVRKDVLLMKDARHPKLIEFIGLILEPQRTFTVEEYCTKGSLASVLENPDIELAWIFRFSLINDLISGMRFLHQSKFLHHGCLTSHCCMITGRWELKIANYGLEVIKGIQHTDDYLFVKNQNEQARILNSTDDLLWMAPESVIATHQNVYLTFPSQQADIYSAGIIINEILTREKPYIELHQSPQVTFDQVCEDNIRPSMKISSTGDESFTNDMVSIVQDCLQTDALLRPTFGALGTRVEALDPYFCGSDSVVDNMAILLERYANDMEYLVKKRTFNLQQRTLELEEERARTETLLKDLKSAKEVAEAAAASKQSFLANMSHEIRTPMNAVIGMSRTLMESDLPPDLYDCAETIESSGNHLMALIDDILDYSKIDSGKLILENSMLDLTYVIESAMKLIASNYLSKGIVLWYTISPDIPIHVYGDLVRLRQILLNLLSNAFKFTQTGYVSVAVELYKPGPDEPPHALDNKEEDTNTIISTERSTTPSACSPFAKNEAMNPMDLTQYLFSVKDTGIGIPESKSDRLFKSFSQVDASTTRNFGGTGLGLAISKKLCRIMDGDMWVESEEGKGSTFFFNVKLQKQPDSNTYGEENHLKKLAEACPNPLVIAEREIIRLKWAKLLNNIGMENSKCMTFLESLHYFKENPNDAQLSLLIVDMDFEIIEKENEGRNSQTATSHSILKHLIGEYKWIKDIPTLCVVDARMKRSRNRVSAELEANFSSSAIQHPQGSRDPIPTPQEEISINPFDALPLSAAISSTPQSPSASLLSKSLESAINDTLHMSITKPFKNSRLLYVLHDLLSTQHLPRKHRLNSLGSTSTTKHSIKGTLSFNTSRRASQNSVSQEQNQLQLSEGEKEKSDGDEDEVYNLHDLSSIKTLVVDDNPVNLKVLSRMLSQIGVSSTTASNGREAFEVIKEASTTSEPYELVFMDIWMPELNGLEAAQKIREELKSTTQPYIIALTACVMPGDREKCMDAGMNGYVSKPIRKEELEASIHTFIQTIVSHHDSSSSEEIVKCSDGN